MSLPAAATTPDWSARADEAARSVTGLFGHRLLFLPGTHIAETVRPSSPLTSLARPWHYWWQAHYLDCLVDAGRRELDGGAGTRTGARTGPWPRSLPRGEDDAGGGVGPGAFALAGRLLTGIRLRNLLTVVNNYYDDMAWLALAVLRLDQPAGRLPGPGRQRTALILRRLDREFDTACTDDLGGGAFWSTKRDFKNTPATAPVALFYARTGNADRAQALLDWLDARLYDPGRGLYLDGLRIAGSGKVVLEDAIYTYNQGPVLAALLELGGGANLERAASLVAAVARSLTVTAQSPTRGAQPPMRGARVLRGEGTGDGGLFTGILVRHLALAAADGRLPPGTRAAAALLVTDTAEAFWAGRREVPAADPLERRGSRLVFSPHPELPAGRTYPPGTAVELSTQLQAWMVLEAASAVARQATAVTNSRNKS